jgi:hypothetical protein
MPSVSQKQKRFMEAVQHNKEFADKVGVPQSVGKEMTEGNVGKKSYENLPEEAPSKKDWMDSPRWSRLKKKLGSK